MHPTLHAIHEDGFLQWCCFMCQDGRSCVLWTKCYEADRRQAQQQGPK